MSSTLIDGGLQAYGEQIATSAEAVRTASESIAATAQEQTTLMIALAESAELLSQESTASAGRLEATRREAEAANIDLQTSLSAVDDLLRSVQRLAELSTGTAAAMDEFGRLMGEIGRMTDFVDEVSDETQLLALNAAIEAARAGKHGLGFAVVAGEVGRLAKTTGESTSAIMELVARIRGEAERTIVSVRASAQTSADSAPIAQAAEVSLQGVTRLSDTVSKALDDAVTLGREHAVRAVEIRRETESIATLAAEQGRQALESAFATQRLAYYGAELMYASRPRDVARVATQTLTIATQLPPGFPPTRAWERFAQQIAERTEGRLRCDLQMPYRGTETDALMRVRSGELDIVSVTSFEASSLLPLAQVFDLPFLFASAYAAHRILDGALGQRILSGFSSFGLVGLGYLENGIRHFTNNVREISRPEDLRGMRIRIQNSVVYLALMHAFKASPKVIPFNAIRAAVQSGDVDGLENPLANLVGAGLHEVQKYITLTAHTYNTQIILGNAARLRDIPEVDRAIFDECLHEVIAWHREVAAEEDSAALTRVRATMQVRELSPTERNDFVRQAQFVWERMAPLFPDEIYDMLLLGELETITEGHAALGGGHEERFDVGEIGAAIDAAVAAVRATATSGANNARNQGPRLGKLALRSAGMSDSNLAFASRFGDLHVELGHAAEQITQTRQTVQGLAQSVGRLAETAKESRRALEQFGASMKQISEIISLVRGVSDRTNLLALNAAIEAARAGEFGTGFNVVADEVRGLAEKTRASTQEMRAALKDLDVRAKAAASAIASSVSETERSARQAAAAEEALARIDAFATGVLVTLELARNEAATEAHRAFAMEGDFREMAALVELHGEESEASVSCTEELERERQALLAQAT